MRMISERRPRKMANEEKETKKKLSKDLHAMTGKTPMVKIDDDEISLEDDDFSQFR